MWQEVEAPRRIGEDGKEFPGGGGWGGWRTGRKMEEWNRMVWLSLWVSVTLRVLSGLSGVDGLFLRGSFGVLSSAAHKV